jgi:hypothetical protein
MLMFGAPPTQIPRLTLGMTFHAQLDFVVLVLTLA